MGAEPYPVETVARLSDEVSEETCIVLVTEETLRGADLRPLSDKLRGQPSWSDLPIIILTRKGGGPENNPAAARLAEALGNVTFVERPFHPITFDSVVRTALKNRHRQFDARARMDELHEGEERLRTALVAGKLGSWELDLSTLKLTTSDACKAAFGREPAEPFTYDDLLVSIHPEDRDRMAAAVRQTVEIGTDYAIEYRTLWPGGGDHWIEVNARRVTDRQGAMRLVGVSLDITARKLAERGLASANELLERRVAERTRELEEAHKQVLAEIDQREKAEEQLRQAQKMEMIGQLTGGVAHDFNNLLMAVIANLDLLKKHLPDDTRTSRLIEGAIKGANRGASLTQRLLAFARRQELALIPRSLRDLVTGMHDLLAKSVGDQIELGFKLQDDLPPAMMDSNQVELALLNLVVNARDAMPNGGRISISMDRAVTADDEDIAAGEYVRLIVSDNGSGMDAETMAKATEPFFSTKELGKGTGLGLSMIHGLAIQLNGALRLTSELGVGTRAELWLPVATEATRIAEPGEAAIPLETSSGKLTVLMVDDDALIAMSTVDLLEDLGHVVIEANSGLEALEIVESGRQIDLIITDYSMPKMNGSQLASAVRKIRPDLPILLATGYAELPPGAELDLPRISKPYTQDQLNQEINRISSKSRG